MTCTWTEMSIIFAGLLGNSTRVLQPRWWLSSLLMTLLSVALSLLSPYQRGDLPPTAITDLARRFPNLVPEKDFEQLEEEFLDYQTTPARDSPRLKMCAQTSSGKLFFKWSTE